MGGGVILRMWSIVFAVSFMCGTGWYCCVAEQGTATFYTPPYVPSLCYGNDPGQFPAGNLFAVASDAIWNNRAACERQYRISCTSATNQGVPMPCKSGSIVVKIVDYCPSGCQGTFNLSADAFADIANINAGKVNIHYQQYDII